MTKYIKNDIKPTNTTSTNSFVPMSVCFWLLQIYMRRSINPSAGWCKRENRHLQLKSNLQKPPSILLRVDLNIWYRRPTQTIIHHRRRNTDRKKEKDRCRKGSRRASAQQLSKLYFRCHGQMYRSVLMVQSDVSEEKQSRWHCQREKILNHIS